MYKVSERQASELRQRCEAIKEIAVPTLFAQIESLVQAADSNRQLTDGEINLLYKLLNRVIVHYEPKDSDESQSEWDDIPKREMDEETELQQSKDMRNHLLLCNKANLKVVESMRRCVRLIVLPEKRKLLSQDHF